MSEAQVKSFVEKILVDKALQGQLDALKDLDSASRTQEIVKIGSEHGFEFSEAEYEECLRAELSEEQLDQVAGGFYVYCR